MGGQRDTAEQKKIQGLASIIRETQMRGEQMEKRKKNQKQSVHAGLAYQRLCLPWVHVFHISPWLALEKWPNCPIEKKRGGILA